MSDDRYLGAMLAEPADTPRQMHHKLELLHTALPFSGDPSTADDLLALLRLLYGVARADLPLARLFEGHVDALQIITRYADRDTALDAATMAAGGKVFGVWNAALTNAPLHMADNRLWGGKSFASGAGIIDYAVVGADTPQGNRLVLIDLAASHPFIDRDWWDVRGMQRSQSHIVRWDGADSASFRCVGLPGDYAREPFFSGGALRFVACHAGGVAGVLDRVRDHLIATQRAGDPHQSARLAELYIDAVSAAAAVRHAAKAWGSPGYVDYVAAARTAVAACAERAITVAQQAVGVSGMFASHPLSAVLTDLMVYLRQPMPDAQRMRVGAAVAEGVLEPCL